MALGLPGGHKEQVMSKTGWKLLQWLQSCLKNYSSVFMRALKNWQNFPRVKQIMTSFWHNMHPGCCNQYKGWLFLKLILIYVVRQLASQKNPCQANELGPINSKIRRKKQTETMRKLKSPGQQAGNPLPLSICAHQNPSHPLHSSTTVMRKYHKIGSIKYPNILGCLKIDQTNIQIYLNAQHFTKQISEDILIFKIWLNIYPNIFKQRPGHKYEYVLYMQASS